VIFCCTRLFSACGVGAAESLALLLRADAVDSAAETLLARGLVTKLPDIGLAPEGDARAVPWARSVDVLTLGEREAAIQRWLRKKRARSTAGVVRYKVRKAVAERRYPQISIVTTLSTLDSRLSSYRPRVAGRFITKAQAAQIQPSLDSSPKAPSSTKSP
jgi:hypothetical protein